MDQIDKLRGHLQNCINHLEMAKRKAYGKTQQSYDKCIQQANKALYETLSPPNMEIQADAETPTPTIKVPHVYDQTLMIK